MKVDCTYDLMGRRIQKIVSTNNGSAYVGQSTNKFIYDGWNLVAILDWTNGLVCSFTWGTDASGTMQGAGGVGGLISMTVYQGTNAETYYYCYDGNHNVVGLVNASNGATAGQWEYDPFLGIIRATGDLAFLNPFLGSTKLYDWETGFYYYGYRYYDPSSGTWPSRDPIGEEAFFQIYTTAWTKHERQSARNESLKPAYVYLANDSTASIDSLGLLRFDPKCSPSDVEKMKKELKDRCQKAKTGNCYRCLSQKYKDALQKLCDDIDKNTGPMVICEDASTDNDCKNRTMCGWERFGKIHICVDLMQDPTISCSLPGCTLLHEAAHAVGSVGGDSAPKYKHPEAYAIAKCAGCPDPPKGVVLPPGY